MIGVPLQNRAVLYRGFFSAILASMLLVLGVSSSVFAIDEKEAVAVSSSSTAVKAGEKAQVTFSLQDDTLLRDDEVVTASAKTSSKTGTFFSDGDPVDESGTFQITGSILKSGWMLQYADSTVGSHDLEIEFSAASFTSSVRISQQVLIEPATPPEVAKPTVVLLPFSTQYTAGEQLMVRGTLLDVPDTMSVRLFAMTAEGVEVAQATTIARGENIDLGTIQLPEQLAEGNYDVYLEVFEGDIFVASAGQSVFIKQVIVDTTPLEEDDSKPGVVFTPITIPLPKPIKPISAGLTAVSARGATGELGGARATIAAAKSSGPAAKEESSENTTGAKSDNQSVEEMIQLSNVQKDSSSVPLEPSKEGWRIFGTPWYVWLGGGVVAYGLWAGARRLFAGGE